MSKNCLLCRVIAEIEQGKNPYFVKEFNTGFAVLEWHQFFEGYTIFISKEHIEELHDLSSVKRALFLKEMGQVAEAVFRVFKPRKLNYELLGNQEPHLHWHLIPRYSTDPSQVPIWEIDKSIRNRALAKEEKIKKIKKKLLKELNR